VYWRKGKGWKEKRERRENEEKGNEYKQEERERI
jgi:hypothetical protein